MTHEAAGRDKVIITIQDPIQQCVRAWLEQPNRPTRRTLSVVVAHGSDGGWPAGLLVDQFRSSVHPSFVFFACIFRPSVHPSVGRCGRAPRSVRRVSSGGRVPSAAGGPAYTAGRYVRSFRSLVRLSFVAHCHSVHLPSVYTRSSTSNSNSDCVSCG